jgi:UDPglucose 6-dehydrogenase
MGIGFVGGASAEVLKAHHEVYLYDKYKHPYNTPEHLGNLAKNSEIIFICVPTPMKLSGEIDYTNLDNALKSLEEQTLKFNRNLEEILVVIRSTAVPGTTERFRQKYEFRFAFNPEFLREKYALEDMKNTDRIVIGSHNQENREKLASAYLPVFPNARYILTDTKTAEMIKYAANCMLAGQIALANELYLICKKLGINYNDVKSAVLHDSRIAKNIDVPGHDGELGFGGKCFPKDMNALIYKAREEGHRPHLLEAIWRLNLEIRENKDWLNIDGATSNKNFGEKD